MLLLETKVMLAQKGSLAASQSLSFDFKNLRKLAMSPRSSPFHDFLRSYVFLYQAVTHVHCGGSVLRSQFLFSKSLQAAKEACDKHAEGLSLFYRGCFDHLDFIEKKKCLQVALRCFKEAGSLGLLQQAEDQLKLLSSQII